jgi:hypothetical protein
MKISGANVCFGANDFLQVKTKWRFQSLKIYMAIEKIFFFKHCRLDLISFGITFLIFAVKHARTHGRKHKHTKLPFSNVSGK